MLTQLSQREKVHWKFYDDLVHDLNGLEDGLARIEFQHTFM